MMLLRIKFTVRTTKRSLSFLGTYIEFDYPNKLQFLTNQTIFAAQYNKKLS